MYFSSMIRNYIFALLVITCYFASAQITCSPADRALYNIKIEALKELKAASLGDSIAKVGTSFLGIPYLEKTLEVGTTESLVINLRGLDCTTFVENVLAFTLVLKTPKKLFHDFTKNLETIRYRNGVLDGYPSRLHYFTDWIRDNEKIGLVKDITTDLGGVMLEKPINFMGTHRDLYPYLKDDKNFKRIQQTEAELAKETLCYLPQNLIKAQEKKIKSGDIIALATAIKGLDVTHTGFAIRQPNGRIHLLHASSSGEVKISKVPLVDYLKNIKNNIGIIIARPLLISS
ncbi:N-acetylmuramoyl-L-alanine amidase-like domain-containing protein [uncultured Croceitalea sp.]|uniref:N-acetylmuramoyl-L-alanine amidase-like domain-containing protein n=1 Tax=uncultured Croceitalea sp. TaxID=1798908 RepID=UPI003305FF19